MEIPYDKLFTAAVSTQQDVSLGILVFLPSQPRMVTRHTYRLTGITYINLA